MRQEAVGDWPPEIGRIALQKSNDLKAEGVEGIRVVDHPPDDLPGPLTQPRFLWKEESRLMAPPSSCSGMAVGAVSFNHVTPSIVRGCRGAGCEGCRHTNAPARSFVFPKKILEDLSGRDGRTAWLILHAVCAEMGGEGAVVDWRCLDVPPKNDGFDADLDGGTNRPCRRPVR